MAKSLDIGERVVAGIRETLSVEGEWSVAADRGFAWWPHRLRQRVWSEPGRYDNDMTVFRVNVATDTVRKVRASSPDAGLALAPLAADATAAAPVFEPKEQTIRLWTAATVHDENAGEMTRLLTAFAALQAAEVGTCVARLAAKVRGAPDFSAHPRSGSRATPSAAIEEVESECRIRGIRPSPWLGSNEIAQVQSLLHRSNAFASIDDSGVTAELPFGQDTSLMNVALAAQHPRLGGGLGVSLVVPAWGGEADTAQLACAFNRAEFGMRTAGYTFGAWGVRAFGPNFAPAYTCFVPAALHRPGMLANFALSMALRAEWIAHMLKPDEPEAEVAQLVAQRIRQHRGD